MIDPNEYKRLLHKAAAYAAKAERSPQEVALKLKSWAKEPISDEEVTLILEELRRENFVDERRYADRYTADKVRFLRKGPLLLRQELREKGIPSQVADQALDSITEEEWQEALAHYLKPKVEGYRRKSHTTYELRTRLMQAAYRRGYPAQVADSVLEDFDLTPSQEYAADE